MWICLCGYPSGYVGYIYPSAYVGHTYPSGYSVDILNIEIIVD